MISKLIALDRGHGGRDCGAVGYVVEADITYRWGQLLYNKLAEAGYDVRFTHVAPLSNRKVSLHKRARAANKMGADLYISVHANAFHETRVSGSEIHVYQHGSYAYALADQLTPHLAYSMPDRGVKVSNFYVLRKTRMPAMLLEVGFTTNSHDAKIISLEASAQVQLFMDKLKEVY